MQNANLHLEAEKFKKLEKELAGVGKNVSLKNRTTFRIGGPARYFFTAETKEDLVRAVRAAKNIGLPFFILGGGSNLLISDRGYQGLVIHVNFSKLDGKAISGAGVFKIRAGAGLRLSQLISFSLEKGFNGLEWAAGIPGTLGGAVYGNAGSFDGSMKDIVSQVEAVEVSCRPTGNSQSGIKDFQIKNKIFKKKECRFDYRESIFKKKKNLIIIEAELRLKRSSKKEIEKKIKDYLQYKKDRQPLGFPSAGSVFKNHQLRAKDKKLKKRFPRIKDFEKQGKIPAAWLIEQCGLRGKKIGGAQISEKHANFIVNRGKARASDVKKLISLTKKEVKRKFSLDLKEEIQFLE